MIRTCVPTTFCVLATTLPCFADHIIDHNDVAGASLLSEATGAAIGQQKWLFNHASVGGNILDGLADLHAADPARYQLVIASVGFDSDNLCDAAPPAATISGTVYECDRGNPGWSDKYTIFDNSVRLAGWHDAAVDVALNKLCFIDPTADVNAYLTMMNSLEADYRATVFVYMTMPLTTDEDSDNVLRNKYNQAVRSYCLANDCFLLDVADIEAFNTDGIAQTFLKNSQTWQMLCPDYTTDGGHLNVTGRDQVALGWYAMAAEITNRVRPSLVWAGAANGSWSTLATDLNWGSAAAWSNNAARTSPNTAAFDLASPATITVNSNIDVGAITFTTGGWTLAAGSGVLAYGATGTISVTTVTGTDAINAVIADGSASGSGGGVTSLIKSGDGTLILGGVNTYTGNTTVNAGTLAGHGTIAGPVIAGSGPHTIYPSAGLPTTSTGTLTVGALTTNANTTLAFNLVTAGASGVNDVIHVTANNGLTLDSGTLEFPNISNAPKSLGYYRIIQYSGSIQGAGINTLLLPDTVGNIVYFLDLARDPGFVDVHRGLLGDANDDGVANFSDFVLLSNNFGQANRGWAGGDFNGDSVTNFSDFVLLSNNFGSTIGANEMAAKDVTSGVPEPASLILLNAGLLAGLGRRRTAALAARRLAAHGQPVGRS